MKQRRRVANRFGQLQAVCVVTALLAAGCSKPAADTRAVDEAVLRDTDAQWAKAAGAKDIDATVAFYSGDAVVLPPNAPLANTGPSIRGIWAELLAPDTSLSWQATKVEVARSGDLGYVSGAYQMTLKDAQARPGADRGKFLEVWKKQADGKWKCIVDTYCSDLPVEPPPAPEKPKAPRHATHYKKGHAKRHS